MAEVLVRPQPGAPFEAEMLRIVRESKICNEEGDPELVIVENGAYQVRVSCDARGVVLFDSLRVVNTETGEESVIWNLDEVGEELTRSSEDPSTALNAILSTIELVHTGRYPPDGVEVEDA